MRESSTAPEQLAQAIRSGDRRRIWDACCEIASLSQNHGKIMALMPLKEELIRLSRDAAQKGGLYGQPVWLNRALSVLEFHEHLATCPCALFGEQDRPDFRLEVSAVGISGKDGGLITAAVKDPALGRVGAITKVNPKVLSTLLDGGFLPVVSPIALGEDGDGLNCNADDAARAVAQALGADRLIFLTDVGGILIDSHNSKTALDHIDVRRAGRSHRRRPPGPWRSGEIPA